MKKVRQTLGAVAGKLSRNSTDSKQQHPGWLELLAGEPGISKDADFRVRMTTGCRDTDYIPKVKDAGKIKRIDGVDYQIMHNNLLVESGGYFGDWMAKIIRELRGHHEPQEEKAFYELLKHIPEQSIMIELGSYWAYYSLWFNKSKKQATNYCFEPDPVNISLGKRNAKINKLENLTFVEAAAGKDHDKAISFKPQEGDRDEVSVPIKSIDGIIKEFNIKKIDIAHMDVQGVELDVIEGARESIRQGKIRFMIVSTHHYMISGDAYLHEKCLKLIQDLGGHIITEHAIHESFSGDGLIVASFSKADAKIRIDVSTNRMDNSLFRSYTKDMDILASAYEKIRQEGQ